MARARFGGRGGAVGTEATRGRALSSAQTGNPIVPDSPQSSERAARAAVAARRAAGTGSLQWWLWGEARGPARAQLSSRAASRRARGEARGNHGKRHLQSRWQSFGRNTHETGSRRFRHYVFFEKCWGGYERVTSWPVGAAGLAFRRPLRRGTRHLLRVDRACSAARRSTQIERAPRGVVEWPEVLPAPFDDRRTISGGPPRKAQLRRLQKPRKSKPDMSGMRGRGQACGWQSASQFTCASTCACRRGCVTSGSLVSF